MRPAVCASFFAACLASACGDSMRVEPVTVQWMDWPWQVAYGQPFRTRLVVSGVCARTPRFRPGATADQSAVTFAPYFVVANENIPCIAEVTSPSLLAYGGVDTAGMAPGLKESRVYEMRAASAIRSSQRCVAKRRCFIWFPETRASCRATPARPGWAHDSGDSGRSYRRSC